MPRSCRTFTLHGLGLAATIGLSVTTADARPVRRLFEPTDLELEAPGVTELDLQVGAVRGPDAFRVSVPDAELDIGLTKQLELDFDGAFALEGPDGGTIHYDHVAPDNIWMSLKAGLLSFTNQSRSRFLTSGLQIGPKLPTANTARGVGLEGLYLLGFGLEHTHVILNFGALVDPAIDGTGRPRAYEGGIDFDQDLDSSGKWSITGEVGTVQFLSSDPNQLHVTSGVAWSPSKTLTLSAIGLVGFSPGSDRYGLLLGVAPKVRLFGK